MNGMLYNFIVRKNENVKCEYERYVMEHITEHYEHRWMHWKILGKLFVHYRILKKKTPLLYWDISEQTNEQIAMTQNGQVQEKEVSKSDTIYNENEKAANDKALDEFKRPQPYHFVKALLKFDVVSFDIFDTLLLRPFEHPTDLFLLVGKRLNYPAVFTNFKEARRMAEREARDEQEQKIGSREVNIYDIYNKLALNIGISADEGARTEIETEMDYLFANPYMQVVFNILRSQNKTIVITSDMYIPTEYMIKILQKCGYEGYDKLYVSCDYKCNKTTGELFRRVIDDYKGKTIVHVGDNREGDIKGAQKAGIKSYLYKNVNEAGKATDAKWMSKAVGSAYNGLKNAYLYNGYSDFPFFYKYGFAYGGIYIWGFCHWIDQMVKREHIDKIIFLSRDGDIYQKIYNKYYESVPNEYIFWSRFANLKYLIEYNKDALYQRVLKHKANNLGSVELGAVLESFAIKIPVKRMKKYGLYPSSIVDEYNLSAIKRMIDENWEDIKLGYEEEIKRAVQEVKTLLGKEKRLAVIDVGWTASGPIGFKTFVEKYIGRDYEIKCWMAGGVGHYGVGEYNLCDYMDGNIETYLFSPRHNRRNEEIHAKENAAVTNNAVFELFTQAQYASFRGIGENNSYVFDIPEVENYEVISQIQKGIMDFCDLYYKTFSKDKYMYNVSGFEAYRPFSGLAFNKRFFEENFEEIIFSYGIGGDYKHQEIETIGRRMERYYGKTK